MQKKTDWDHEFVLIQPSKSKFKRQMQIHMKLINKNYPIICNIMD